MLSQGLLKAREGRLHVLDRMNSGTACRLVHFFAAWTPWAAVMVTPVPALRPLTRAEKHFASLRLRFLFFAR